nr:ABC transporter permease [Lachnospiraceae bacterium]
EYIAETDELKEVEIPVSFAGYVDKEDVAEYAAFHGKALWLIVSEQTAGYLESFLPEEERAGIGFRTMLFRVNTGDSDLVRRLSQIKDANGDSAIYSASLLSSFTDFKNVITNIVSIVAVCFTILIAVICLLNLYNSVMGRRYARQRELSVLRSMGITKKQKTGMLMLENARLLARAYVYSALITTAFVVCLHRLLDSWFGRMNFTLPLWMIALSVLVSCAGLGLFTLAGYGDSKKTQLIDEVRTEVV